jgi:ribonuclease D
MQKPKDDSNQNKQNQVEPPVITSTAELASFCHNVADDEFIAVDTEFLRETTYYPKLCLIQVAGAAHSALIDPLADGIDLQPFLDLMDNKSIMKVFHAARQDVEILLQMSGKVPTPLFDTQVAAMVCGFGDQIGYEAIARKIAGAAIDKSSQFTDWSKRPLTAKQKIYALSDVTHLRVIYLSLKDQIRQEQRETWLEGELASLADPKLYIVDPAQTWRRIKARIQSKKQQATLMEVAAWREREAQKRDVPRSRVLKDEAVAEIATQVPRSRQDLADLRLLPRSMAENAAGADIIAAVERALNRDPAEIPTPRSKVDPMPPMAEALAEILKLALKVVCQNTQVAPKLVASTAEIEAFAQDINADVPFLHGWRREAFGDIALKLCKGEAVIGVKNGKAAVMPV